MDIKALVVDNNPVLLRAVAAILQQEGCTVKTAGTGLEALEIADAFTPDFVVTDLIMPMVSGEQLCRILRNTKKHQGVFIVVLSATVLEDRERIFREVQCDMCIAKGNLQEIRQHVREALQMYRQRSSTIAGENQKSERIPDGLQPSEMTSELLLEKRHYSDILANLEEGIIELNNQGKVIAVNSSALNILSCREESLIGMLLPEAVAWGIFKKEIEQWTDRQLIALGMENYDIFDDNPLLLNDKIVTASFLPISEADSNFGLCILRDISRRYKAEKHTKELNNALKLVKKMDAISCMAGGVAHDFNNLLTVICGNLDIVTLYGENQSAEERNKLLTQARKASLVAVDLTRQISCFSNFGITNREDVQVEQLVQETVGRFFNWTKERYRIEINCLERHVHADPEELAVALGNVLQNALEACPDEAIRIVVDENNFTTPQLMSGQFVPAGKYVRIDICDRGRGISSELLFRIFDPYYSTKERSALKGMGLGLTVVYAIMRNHGGYVVVRSTPNFGTTVSLYIPSLPSEKPSAVAVEQPPAEDRRILLIEPDRQIGEIGKIMLSHLGFSVKVYRNRAGAVAELKKRKGDLHMPRPLIIIAVSETHDESAAQTCKLLHEIDPALQIIAMSGTVLDPIMVNYRDYGFVNAIPKPFSMDSLRHITNTVLHS